MPAASTHSTTQPQTKAQLREHFHKCLQSFFGQRQGEDKQLAEKKIQEILTTFLKSNDGYWGAYKALPEEPSLEVVFQDSSKQVKWVFSRIEGTELHWYQPGLKGFKAGALKVAEPVIEGAKEVKTANINGMIIPGMSFDRQGYRLGRGKGFYDRALANFSGIKIGVAYVCQMVEALPVEKHDVQVDLVISENGLFKPNLKIEGL